MTASTQQGKGGVFEARSSNARVELAWYDNGKFAWFELQLCQPGTWADCVVQGDKVQANIGTSYSLRIEWDGKVARWFVDGIQKGSWEESIGFGSDTPQVCYSGSGGLEGWKGTIRDLAFSDLAHAEAMALPSSVPAPPAQDGNACYMYWDEAEGAPCKLFSGSRANTWFDGSYGDQTCEERSKWWSGQAWHQCLKDSGLPYPGNIVIKSREDVYYMVQMWKQAVALPSSVPAPPAQDGNACYMYWDEAEGAPCKLFSGSRANTWFDGSYGDQTCEERSKWWSGRVWNQCLKDSGLPYPGNIVIKNREDVYYMVQMWKQGR